MQTIFKEMAVKFPSWFMPILEKQSFSHYHAYFKDLRHNHKSETLVALGRLGAPRELVEKYINITEDIVSRYNPDEELTEKREIDEIKSDNMEDYLGKNTAFYKLLNYYKKMHSEKYNKDTLKMVKDVCPSIIDGPVYGLYHGIIQMGYGFGAGFDEMVLEGIAYMFQQYSPLYMDDMKNPKRTDLSTFGYGNRPFNDILADLRNKIHVDKNSDGEEKKSLNDWNINKLSRTSALTQYADFFMDLANNIQLPEWFSPNSKEMSQIEKLCDWVLDVAIELFTTSNSVNDFVLLHGVTGSWSGRLVLPLLDYDSALLGIRSLLSGLLIIYVEQKAPALEKTPKDFFTEEQIDQKVWDKFLDSLFNSDQIYEYHIYKVIQCVFDRWKEMPDGRYSKHYYAAACAAKDNGISGLVSYPGNTRNDILAFD